MKLFVAGCSVSDYTLVDKVYGDFLAEKLNIDYIHEAAGCGSNYRIWRTITKHVMDDNLTDNDLLIVQYTNSIRYEFWSSIQRPPSPPKEFIDKRYICEEEYDGGALIRFKLDSYQWQNNKIDTDFHETFQKYFLSEKYSNELFEINNYNFQHMLINKNIKTIFIYPGRGPVPILGKNLYDMLLDEFKRNYYAWPYDSVNDRGFDLPNDRTHFNQKGHECLADRLYEHITKLGILA